MTSQNVYDAAIIGASIAGSAAAIFFAQKGAKVALIERDADPAAHKKLCTHYIQASATPAIERLGLAEKIEAAGGLRNDVVVYTRWGCIRAPSLANHQAAGLWLQHQTGKARPDAARNGSRYIRGRFHPRVFRA